RMRCVVVLPAGRRQSALLVLASTHRAVNGTRRLIDNRQLDSSTVQLPRSLATCWRVRVRWAPDRRRGRSDRRGARSPDAVWVEVIQNLLVPRTPDFESRRDRGVLDRQPVADFPAGTCETILE